MFSRSDYRLVHHGVPQAEVPVPGRAGVPDHVAGAHHAVLPHPDGGRAAVPGLLRRGGRRADEDRGLSSARLKGAQ